MNYEKVNTESFPVKNIRKKKELFEYIFPHLNVQYVISAAGGLKTIKAKAVV